MAIIDLNKFEDHLLLTRADVAEWLGVNVRTITRMTVEDSPGMPSIVMAGRLRYHAGQVKSWITAKSTRKNKPGMTATKTSYGAAARAERAARAA